MNIGSYEFMSSASQYLTSPDNPAYVFATGDFTIEAWVKSFAGGPVLAKRTKSTAGFSLSLGLNVITFTTRNTAQAYYNVTTSGIGICDGTWHHVAAVRSKDQCAIYLDGVAQTVQVSSHNANPPLDVSSKTRLTIGTDDDPSATIKYFNGEISEIRLWNQARDPDELLEYMTTRIRSADLSPHLVGYWPGIYGIASDFSLTENATLQQGTSMMMLTGTHPPLFVSQNDMTFLYTGIYDAWTRDLSPLGTWKPASTIALTSSGFVVWNGHVLQGSSISGTVINIPGRKSDADDQPAMSLSFFLEGSDPNFWDSPQDRAVIQGYFPGSATYSIIRGLSKPLQVGCGLLMNVGTGLTLANSSGKATLLPFASGQHNHVCEYENGGILDMNTNLALQANNTTPGSSLSFFPPDLTAVHQAWTFQPNGNVCLTSDPSISLSINPAGTAPIMATMNADDNNQKWFALGESQKLYNGSNSNTVLAAVSNSSVIATVEKDGTSMFLWYTFRDFLISQTYGLALTVLASPQDTKVGTKLGLVKWNPSNQQQQFQLRGNSYVHTTSGLMLQRQGDGTIILTSITSTLSPAAMWSWSQPVQMPTLANGHVDRHTAREGKQSQGVVKYVVDIVTGDDIAAGTDDMVKIQLFSDYDELAWQILKNSETHDDPFERGCSDRFIFEDRDIGQIRGFNIKYGEDTWFYLDRWVLSSISVYCTGYPNLSTFWNPSMNGSIGQFEVPYTFKAYFKVAQREATDSMSMGMAPATDKIGSSFGWYHTWISVNQPYSTTKTWFDCAGGHEGPGTINDVVEGNCKLDDVVRMSTGYSISAAHPLQSSYGTNRTDGVGNANVRADGSVKWDGQCHQMANRYLWTCHPSMSIDNATNKPHGYGLSCFAFGLYGVGFQAWCKQAGFPNAPEDQFYNMYTIIQKYVPDRKAATKVFNAMCNFTAFFPPSPPSPQPPQVQPDPNGPVVSDMMKQVRAGGATIPAMSNMFNLTQDEINELLDQ